MAVRAEPTPGVGSDSEPRSRRALLAAGLGGVAAWLVGALGQPGPVDAAVGGNAKLGKANSAGSATTKVTSGGSSASLFGNQTGSGFGVRGESATGAGVLGTAKAANRAGVRGRNTAATSSGGAGVSAEGGQNHGLVAATANGAADGIQASNTGAVDGGGAAIRAVASVGTAIRATTTGGASDGIQASNTGAVDGGGAAIRAVASVGTAIRATTTGGVTAIRGDNLAQGSIGVAGNAISAGGIGVAANGNSDTGIGVRATGFVAVERTVPHSWWHRRSRHRCRCRLDRRRGSDLGQRPGGRRPGARQQHGARGGARPAPSRDRPGLRCRRQDRFDDRRRGRRQRHGRRSVQRRRRQRQLARVRGAGAAGVIGTALLKGVRGTATSVNGVGVQGENVASSGGRANAGVVGTVTSADAIGVVGSSPATDGRGHRRRRHQRRRHGHRRPGQRPRRLGDRRPGLGHDRRVVHRNADRCGQRPGQRGGLGGRDRRRRQDLPHRPPARPGQPVPGARVRRERRAPQRVRRHAHPRPRRVGDGHAPGLVRGAQRERSLPAHARSARRCRASTSLGRGTDGAFRIAGGAPGGDVCWQLTGVRRDAYAKANPLAVDAPKIGRGEGAATCTRRRSGWTRRRASAR